jgi:hypothetical protein
MSGRARKVVHADIKSVNPPQRAAHSLVVPNMRWEATTFPGIKIKVLYTDDNDMHFLAQSHIFPLKYIAVRESAFDVVDGARSSQQRGALW